MTTPTFQSDFPNVRDSTSCPNCGGKKAPRFLACDACAMAASTDQERAQILEKVREAESFLARPISAKEWASV